MLHQLIQQVESGMDEYDLSRAVEPFVGFIDQLTNWYIRRSRRRFWAEEDSLDRREAFGTLYYVLTHLTTIAAPFVPFISEAIYQNLRTSHDPRSVHHCDYPAYHPEWRDIALEEGMAALQAVVSLGHGLRKEHKLKVRQPLPLAEVACESSTHLEFLEGQRHLIEEELNVKKVVFHVDDRPFVAWKAKPNFRILGKKVGKQLLEAQAIIGAFSHHELHQLLSGQSIEIELPQGTFCLMPEDVQVERIVRGRLNSSNLWRGDNCPRYFVK